MNTRSRISSIVLLALLFALAASLIGAGSGSALAPLAEESTPTMTATLAATATPTPTATTPLPTPFPTNTLLPTAPPPPTPAPDCRELIADGGFEYFGLWQMGVSPRPAAYTRSDKHSGEQSIRLGIPPTEENAYSWSSIRQWINIPADANSAILTFWYRPYTEETPGAAAKAFNWDSYTIAPPSVAEARTEANTWQARDWQECLLLDESEAVVAILMRETANYGLWTQRFVDLSAYRGRRVALYFNVFNNGSGGRSWMYVDDVSVRTCSGGEGALSGKVFMQGRVTHDDALVEMETIGGAPTDASGSFLFTHIPAGNYRLLASKAGYLSSLNDSASVLAGGTSAVPNTELLGGDANNDQVIDLWDLVIVASSYGENPPLDGRADVNNDGWADLLDLVMIGVNYNRWGPTSWGIPYAAAAQEPLQGKVTLRFDLKRRLQVIGKDMQGVYGLALRLKFAPSADWKLPNLRSQELQAQAGALLSEREVYVARNRLNWQAGEVVYAMTLLRPAAPIKGDGLLLEAPLSIAGLGPNQTLEGEVMLVGMRGEVIRQAVSVRVR
jgi:hypothetical protein